MKKLNGNVISDKMIGSLGVKVSTQKMHPKYGKSILTSKKYTVQPDKGAKLGDFVEIQEVKPISKTKKWKVSAILS